MTKTSVQFITLSEEESGQRLDNFLLRILSGVPKTRIYKAIRKGEVRINKGRAKPETKLVAGDLVRIPPLDVADVKAAASIPDRWFRRIEQSIVYDDKDLIVLNKPTGLARAYPDRGHNTKCSPYLQALSLNEVASYFNGRQATGHGVAKPMAGNLPTCRTSR